MVISPLTGWKSLIATGTPSSARGRPSVPGVLGLGLLRLLARPIEIVVGDGVERGIDRLRTGDLCVQQLHRRERARLEAPQRLTRREIAKLQVRRCQDRLLPHPRRSPYPAARLRPSREIHDPSRRRWPRCSGPRSQAACRARVSSRPRRRRTRGTPRDRHRAGPRSACRSARRKMRSRSARSSPGTG